MRYLNPERRPIPPELPSDPSRVPPGEVPINTPPEKGPQRPEPLPIGPQRPRPVARAWLMTSSILACIVVGAAAALAQAPAGKDTSELEPANPQQSECSQIGDSEERGRCLRRNQPSGAPPTGKTTGDSPAGVAPSVEREMRTAPDVEPVKPADPPDPE
jgi:hypothetical protein